MGIFFLVLPDFVVYSLPPSSLPKCDDGVVEFRGEVSFFPPNSMLLEAKAALAFWGIEGGRFYLEKA